MACVRYERARSLKPFPASLRQKNFAVTESNSQKSADQRVSGCNGDVLAKQLNGALLTF